MALLYLTQGNTRPPVRFTLKDVNGNPVDITGCTLIFRMIVIGSLVPTVLDGECTIDTAGSGLCHYDWAEHDLDVAGSYHGQLNVTFPDETNQDTNIMGFEVTPSIT